MRALAEPARASRTMGEPFEMHRVSSTPFNYQSSVTGAAAVASIRSPLPLCGSAFVGHVAD